MANFKRIYREYLNTVKGDIEVQMRAQGRVATRTAIDSLRVVANQFLTAEIRGVKYLQYLEDGVGSQPGFFGRGLINNIFIWMKAKGISPRRNGEVQPSTETNIRRSAGAIARHIVNNGTQIRQGVGPHSHGLDLTTAIEENRDALGVEVGREMALEFTEIMKIKRK